MQPAVRYEKRALVGVVTLNRPDNRNSMTPELLGAFESVIDQALSDAGLRCLVITGQGSCFSAGADFRSAVQLGDEAQMAHERSFAMYRPFLRVLDARVPVIAALNGHAVGGGFGLSLLCDIRIANKGAKLGANFAKLGLHPGLGISYLLPRLVGLAHASELLYTGRLVDGIEALQMGLVSRALPEAEVLPCAMSLAEQIADNAPLAVQMTKQSIREHLAWDVRSGAHREAFAQAETLTTRDAAEGMSALLEKRSPKFEGR